MTFLERKITLQFLLGNQAVFNEAGDNTITLEGLRVETHITKTTGPLVGEAYIRVYGLQPSTLFKLASLNETTAVVQQNRIIVRAGDSKIGMPVVFDGMIRVAQADMSQQPTTALNIIAMGNGALPTKVLPPRSYRGDVDAASIVRDIATAAGLDFENNGVSAILSTQYLWGDAWKQFEDCKVAGGFEGTVDKRVIAIWPRGGSRKGFVPVISPETGLVGYPTYASLADGGGVALTTVFNPDISIGGNVIVKSSIPAANGEWQAQHVSHDLESMIPDGAWFTHFVGAGLGQ